MRSFPILGTAALVAGHGLLDKITVDGTVYPAFDTRVDHDFPGGVERIMWGYSKSRVNGTAPVDNVDSPDIACRFNPLISPALTAPARAGSNITFEWTEWFASHKGPVLTYMGFMPSENTSVNQVDFFKIDQDTYDAKTDRWGTHNLIDNNNTRTVTIPSNLRPGIYVVRHEIIGLHFAWQEKSVPGQIGAQPYPNCMKVRVIGSGTDSPPGERFPGAYGWRDPGLLVNVHYGPKRYVPPGPPVYKGERNPPQGPIPVVTETGDLTGERGERYARIKAERGQVIKNAVAGDLKKGMKGLGGCFWEDGADPSTVKCSTINPDNPAPFIGYAQPKESPMYTDKPGSLMRGQKPPPKLYGNENNPRRFKA